MKKALTFLLTLILNVSFAQDSLPFKKRFYLELNGGAGIYKADIITSGHGIYYPGYGYYSSKYKGEIKNMYISGSVGGFYKYRWIKAGVFYQGGWPKNEIFQHSFNLGVGFNTFGWLKKSIVWMGPFASVGGIIPVDGRSYIGSHRMDLGADLYIKNFHLGYRYSWWDGANSIELSKMKIHYLEIGYAIPLRRKEMSRKWSYSDTLPVKERFFLEFDGLFGISQSGYYNNPKIYGLSLSIMYRDRFCKLALNHENINIDQNSLLFEVGFNTLVKVKNKKWWFGPVLSGGSIFDFGSRLFQVARLGGGMDLYFKNFHLGYRHIWSPTSGEIYQDDYIRLGYALPLRKREKTPN